MSSKPMVPVEEYLRMRFEGPDPEYLDGELVERHLGGTPHSTVQKRFIGVFLQLEATTSLRAFPELHLRTESSRFRIADVAVFAAEPVEDIPSSPPLIIIEIISPGDSWREMRRKAQEIAAWGVKYIWFADPEFHKFSIFEDGSIRDVPMLELPEFGVAITPEQVFG